MTIREAVEVLKVARAEAEWESPMDVAAALDVAIEATSKQEPMKPVVGTYGIFCRVCADGKRTISPVRQYLYRCQKFCPNCGQAIDWRVENDD